jgi:hypothetical protein
MRSPKPSKKLVAILVISLAASLAIPFTLASTSAPTPVIPSQCEAAIATGWSAEPLINARMTMTNYEDGGTVGYWALDNLAESFTVWQNTGTSLNTFCSLDEYSGTWKTFAGAISPENVTEPQGGSGAMKGAIVKLFTGTFLGPYCKSKCSGTHSSKPLKGNIGVFNLGGTSQQILLGYYANQTQFSPNGYLTFYFSAPSVTSTPVWSYIYTRGNGVGYGNMWVYDSAGSIGDIVT